MSELAFNYKNRRFTPKGDAVSWLVERLRDGQRGQLDAVMNDEGAPLTAPIATTPRSAFRALVKNQPGRYRLTQLDADMMPIEDAEVAYVTVPPIESARAIEEELAAEPVAYDDAPAAHRPTAPAPAYRNAAPATSVPSTSVPATITSPFGTWPALPIPTALSGTEYLLAEALRGQVQMFQVLAGALADRSATNATGASQMMTAAAELLRAADGASMPRREPPPLPPAPPPAPVPPPAPAPAPTVVYAMPRNAAFADDGYDDDDEQAEDGEDGEDDDAAPIDVTEEDFFAKANKLVAKVAEAIAPVASVAQMVMGAGLGGLGGLFGGGGGDGTRNAADASTPAAEPDAAPDDDELADPMFAHLRASHVLAVSHELGANDGSIFRHMLRAMEPADRRMFVDRLCSMPLDEAVPYAAEKVAWLKSRMARSRTRCAPTAEHVDEDAAISADPGDDDDTSTDHDPDDPNQEHDATHHDADDRDHTDDHADQEHDTTQHDADDEPTHLSDPEHARDPQLDHLSETVALTGAERMTVEPATTTVPRSPMPPASTPATIPATVIAPAEVPRPLTPDVAAHMQRIAKHLTFREILAAKSLINDTSIADRNGWIARLMALEPTEAATVVRAELARRAGRTS